MKKIPVKNYLYLVVILIVTFLAVINVLDMYKLRTRKETDIYKNSNTITWKEFEAYISENQDAIIYIYDKYNSSYSDFEKDLEEKIETLYLEDKFIYMDKKELNKKFIEQLYNDYGVKVKYNKKPIIILIIDNEIVRLVEVNDETDIDSLNLGDLK